jgi:DNA repair exonuclease SbcCD ATPase subunit
LIIFEKVRWRNLLSTGNQFTEIDLRRSNSTLVVGANGSGKSTMLDALAFGLFGVPHRNILKPQLLNSINERNLEVEVEFTIGPTKYLVRRGLKPRLFEIHKDGALINQESDSRDYQSFLEQTILCMSYKSFHQIVVLGSSSFIPFMQLRAKDRRQVIEDLLDIGIFTRMNALLKTKTSQVKERFRDTEAKLDVTQSKIGIQKKYIRDLQSLNKDLAERKHTQIAEAKASYKDHEVEAKKLEGIASKGRQEYMKRNSSLASSDQAARELMSRYRAEIQTHKTQIGFFHDTDTCPVCTQELDPKVAQARTKTHEEKIAWLAGKVVEMNVTLASIAERRAALDQIRIGIQATEDKAKGHRHEMAARHREIEGLSEELNDIMERSDDVGQAQQDLSGLELDIRELGDKKLGLTNQLTYNAAIFEMLKDSGIKTKIIQQYLPVMNKLINQYLQTLDFFVYFTLDETFQEVIKSRHQDTFSYSSFSEGEKQRLDLAILFMFRQIARMKNSVVTNLLVLDETFDSSLDSDGVDNLLRILETLDSGTNVFVISHKRHILDSKFPDKLVFEKVGNYSVVREE